MAQGRVAREASSRSGAPSRVGGFSLIEMAVVVVILGLLLGGLLAPLAAQQDAQKTAETLS